MSAKLDSIISAEISDPKLDILLYDTMKSTNIYGHMEIWTETRRLYSMVHVASNIYVHFPRIRTLQITDITSIESGLHLMAILLLKLMK